MISSVCSWFSRVLRPEKEPERGYAIPGVDFTPEELFREIRFHVPEFKYELQIDKRHSLS